MSLSVSMRDAVAAATGEKKKPRSPLRLLLILLAAALLGGAGWYYFAGRKPKVVMSIPLNPKGDTSSRGLWSAGPGELLFVGDGTVQLIDIQARKTRWSVKMPRLAPVDSQWQAGVNARFARLQQWADELARKRATLTSQDAIKAFNAEAAKYHAELAAARAESATPKAPAPPGRELPEPTEGDEKARPYAFGGDRSKVDVLKTVTDAEKQIVQERIKKRATKLDAWRRMLDAKKANAKSAFQKNAAEEEEKRYSAELAEQKKDEGSLGAIKQPPPKAEQEEQEHTFADSYETDKPAAAFCSDRLWVIEGMHAVAFDRTSGAVKADVRLAGAALHVFASGDTVQVIASAGPEAVQITKLTAAAPQSFYFPTGRHEAAYSHDDAGVIPNVQKLRTEFSAAGGSLMRMEIRLKEKSIRTRDAIKPGSDKKLEETAGASAAHSLDELKSMAALIQNDAARLNGSNIERIDESTYEITVSRPFESAAQLWSTTLKGRVQVISTPSLHIVTAGTKLLAFSSGNKPAWEATLGAPVPVRLRDSDSEGETPLLETGGKLFFADGAFLSAFDAANGQAAWRLPSVGIRKIAADSDGGIYVHSENLSVESLAYVNDSTFRDSVPVTLRVNSTDGKIRWQSQKCRGIWASGADVYVLREGKNPGDIENEVFDPQKAVEARVKVFKVSRGSGKPLWEWFQTRRPQAVEVQGKNVALLFSDELQLISSICW